MITELDFCPLTGDRPPACAYCGEVRGVRPFVRFYPARTETPMCEECVGCRVMGDRWDAAARAWVPGDGGRAS